jgi:hypothetical protein
MGISVTYLWYMAERGLLKPGDRVLDIGASYLYDLTAEDVVRFCRRFGQDAASDVADDLAERSRVRPGRQKLFLSELMRVAGFDYTSYDVCPGEDTIVFDLNREEMPAGDRGCYDLVLNFGTSEHVINQVNTFKVMHDALRVGGVLFHQSPSIGWVDHGYFAYHPRFFEDLKLANSYDRIDVWMSKTIQCDKPALDFRDQLQPLVHGSGFASGMPDSLPCCNLNVVHRKVVDAPFRVSLELSTSHSGLSPEISAIHLEDPVVHQTRAVDLISSLLKRGMARLMPG